MNAPGKRPLDAGAQELRLRLARFDRKARGHSFVDRTVSVRVRP
ncbi:MAG TPA: hypothetical protein VGG37_04770 [Opitutaceae bacterium]|jgi:hypothetical protein